MIGYIYRIYNSSDSYYGSTTVTLAERLRRHQRDYYKYTRGEIKNKMSSFIIFEKKNDRYEIECVEEVHENTKEALENKLKEREAFYISNNECVNQNLPVRTAEEKRLQRNRIQREYYHRKKNEKKDQSN